MSTTYANAAVEALHEAARKSYRGGFEAGTRFAQAHSAVAKATDVVEVMSRTIDLLAAAEAMHDQFDGAVKDIRATLAAQMSETGATTIQGKYHSAHLARRPAFVSIDNEELLPAEFIVQKPGIDKRAIAAAIKDGAQVPGASLLTPNEPVLVLKARKETSQ
jgi:hypothetical protein